jgi:biotin carboxyl carrier protein
MRRYTIDVGGKSYVIDIQELTLERFQVLVDGQAFEVRLAAEESLSGGAVTPEIVPLASLPMPAGPAAPAGDGARPPAPTGPPPSAPAAPGQSPDGYATVRAPMPGTILAIGVAAGDSVESGQPVLTLEAMKMQNILRAPRAGVVAAVLVQPGQPVGHGDALIQLAEAPR